MLPALHVLVKWMFPVIRTVSAALIAGVVEFGYKGQNMENFLQN